MAEYIDKKYLDRKFQIDMMALRGGTIFDTKEIIDSLPTADVIELKPILEEYEELIQTNPTNKQIDEFCIKTMRKILCDYYVEKI